MSKDISIRQSQALFPMGVGSIYNYQGQSFISCDIAMWRNLKKIREERLEAKLNVDYLCVPPVYRDDRPKEGIPFARFPHWLFCQRDNCRRLHRFKFNEETGLHPLCPDCGSKLYPIRFVVACENGHLSDFPWAYWAHRNHPIKCTNQNHLRFRVKAGDADGSLASLEVKCDHCKQGNDLSQISGFKPRCGGTHPWRMNEVPLHPCMANTKVLQRGASNLRYDFSLEAISIPPYSDFSYWSDSSQGIMAHDLFDYIVERCDDLETPKCSIMIEAIAGDTDTTEEAVIAAILSSRGENLNNGGNDDLEHAEFKALKAPDRQHDPRDRFQKRRAPLSEYLEGLPPGKESEQIEIIASFIDSIHMVTRLRNVRALTGFSRILRNTDNRVAVDLGKNLRWKPAIEYYGEGIFIEFNGPAINAWANKASAKTRGNLLIEKTLKLPEGFRKSLPGGNFFQPTPQFLCLHTFAHIMMLKLQFFAGYSSSAIKEKIYCSFPGMDYEMYGVLLFTSAGDVEGSMGGLARMGLPQNFMPLIVEAIIDARNCSYDPVCYESSGQGIDALNLAACHACTLLPETSCNYRNQFLDRSTLLDKSGGLFCDIEEVV